MSSKGKNSQTAFSFNVFLIAILVLSGSCVNFAHAQSDTEEPAFIGGMSCGTSTCHGARVESSYGNILRNEFNTWYEQDPHSQSYTALTSPLGNQIGENLGIDPTNDPKCISCHTTPTQQYEVMDGFTRSEGVSCEGCHGPASLWLKAHTVPDSSVDLFKLGMFPTADPQNRGKLCLSCHLGGEGDQLITHKMMAAGHPRLVFELATFTQIQPAHYRPDADYRARKPRTEEIRVWATGQIMASQQFLRLASEHVSMDDSLFPELTFYECHTCHHPVDTVRWQTRKTNPLGPGQVRINDSALLISIALLKVMDSESAILLSDFVSKLHKDSLNSKDELIATMKKIDHELGSVLGQINDFEFSPNQVADILREISNAGMGGEYSDFSSAEQAVMAASVLVNDLYRSGNTELLPKNIDNELDDFYKTLENEDNFRPRRLQTKMRKLKGSMD